MTDAYIYDSVRTPRGKGRPDGSLHEVTAARLSAVALNALKERNNLDGHAVEDVIWGNVTQVGEQGACLARTAVLASDLDESEAGFAERVVKYSETKVSDMMLKIHGKGIQADSRLIDGLRMLYKFKVTVLPVYDGEELVGVLRDSDLFLATANILTQ